jgi:aspartyl-tRNA(Asn)/glutamyl-tRNA(Gln) amidotransferase subunit B
LNRGGTPLLEIVSEPDLRSPAQASFYLKALRDILIFAGVTDGNMEEGSLRCDANISLRPIGTEPLGTKVEIKNLNSFRFLELALEAEALRQAALLSRGETIIQETRTFDPATGETSAMRGKEDAHDYRYFPEPDLLPLEISPTWIDRVRQELPELPEEKRARYLRLGLNEEQCHVLLADFSLALFFDRSAATFPVSELPGFAKWFLNNFLGEVGRSGKKLEELPASSASEVFSLIAEGRVTLSSANEILRQHLASGKPPAELLEQLGLKIVQNETELAERATEIIRAYPAVVADYHAGQTKVLGFLIGKTIKSLSGQVDPKRVAAILVELLQKEG